MSAASTASAAPAPYRLMVCRRARASRWRCRSTAPRFAPSKASRPSPAAYLTCRRPSAAITRYNGGSVRPASSWRSISICIAIPIRTRRNCATISAGICAAAPAMPRYWRRRWMPPKRCERRPRMLDLGTSFLASVERSPSALAIVDGAVRLTYAEWYRGISSVLAGLDALGLKRDDHLLTVAQNRWEAATVHWACQFAGVIVTPVNWRATPHVLGFLVEDSDVKALVYDAATAEAVVRSRAAQALPRVALGEPKSGEIGWTALAGRDAPDAEPRVSPEAWSVMLYTSGTTARPKGVPRRQSVEPAAALAHVAQNMYGNGERTLGVMPLYHTMGVRSLIAMSLIGGVFVCMPRFDVARALELIASEKITNLYLVPTLYHDL